jgi:serine/threonine-protein kinase
MWLNGRYRIDVQVGTGRSSVVWRGHDVRLRRPVAVKTPANMATVSGRRRLFRKEAMVTARVDHPNVASVYDYGETNDGAPFLVLEFVAGPTLAKRLASHGPLPHTETARVCAAVASALAAAHERGVVHGDVKPANVMISSTGPRIVDFGTAAAIEQYGDDPSFAGGTPAYLAPEQPTGPPGPEADMYAFGLLLRDCLTAHRSRPDAEPPAVLAAETGRWPWVPATAPDPLKDLVAACLAPVPNQRPDSAQAATVLIATVRHRVGGEQPHRPGHRRVRRLTPGGPGALAWGVTEAPLTPTADRKHWPLHV